MGNLDSSSAKVDGFQNEGDSMSKKRPNKSLLSNPEIGRALTEDRNSQTTFAVEVEYSPSLIEKAQSLVGDGVSFTLQKLPKQNWIDPRVDPQPIQPQEPTQTHREFADAAIGKMAESLGVPSPSPDYESPSFSSARVDMQASLDPIPREDEARPCSLCESRRPIGTSYSRVYCTKRQVRYCKCHYCGHTWSQERK